MIRSSADTAASHDVNDLRLALLYRIRRSAAIPQDVDDLIAAVRADSHPAWQPIATAPKDADTHGMTPTVILGFVADEEHYSPRSREGYWDHALGRWSSVLDPAWTWSPQPTHWMPLPDPPAAPE